MNSILSLIIDIESGFVRGALVVHTPGQMARVLYTVSSTIIDKSSKKTSQTFLDAMAHAVKEVTHIISTKALPAIRAKGIALPISKVHCVLSTPWALSKTKTVKVSYPKDTHISKETVEGIIDAEREELTKQFSAEHSAVSEDISRQQDLVFIEQKIFEIKLNGYPVNHFQNKHGRELEVSFAVTVSSKDILAAIHKMIERNLSDAVDAYHSSLLLQYAAFRRLSAVRDDYIATHIHADLSDIIVVRQGVCSILASFPFGTNAFIKKSAHVLKQSESLTRSALSMSGHNKLHVDSEKAVRDLSDPIIKEWAAEFWKTLSLSGDVRSLPRTMILSVREHFPFFEKALKEHARGTALTITALDEVLLEKIVHYERGQDTNSLLSMYVCALDGAQHVDF